MLNSGWRPFCLYQLFPHHSIYSSFELFHQYYFTFSSLATLTNSSSSLLNFFFNIIKNSSVNLNSTSSDSKSSNKFSFYTLANLSYTYDNTHQICSSTDTFHILILKYNLYTIMNLTTLLGSPPNIDGLTISI